MWHGLGRRDWGHGAGGLWAVCDESEEVRFVKEGGVEGDESLCAVCQGGGRGYKGVDEGVGEEMGGNDGGGVTVKVVAMGGRSDRSGQ